MMVLRRYLLYFFTFYLLYAIVSKVEQNKLTKDIKRPQEGMKRLPGAMKMFQGNTRDFNEI